MEADDNKILKCYKKYYFSGDILKKLAAILLMALFAFNLFGYRLLFHFLQQQSDIQLETSLDNNDYNEKDLIIIEVPIYLPYVTETRDFERFDGEVNVDGKIYKYVKRKISNNKLVLLCLPYENKMRLEAAKTDFFKNVNDLQNTGSKKSDHSKSFSGKNLSSEYSQDIFSYEFSCSSDIEKISFAHAIGSLISFPPNTPEQPPEQA